MCCKIIYKEIDSKTKERVRDRFTHLYLLNRTRTRKSPMKHF